MRLVSLVLLITFESLFVNYASSQCVSLNNTLLNNCFQAGFNESEFTKSRPLQNISNLIMSMKTKFDNCSSSLSTLMTCSLHVPRCSNTSSRKLPSREECKKFVSGCQDVSVDTEGLMALFRGLCDLLPLCASPSDRSNITAEDYVSCKPLSIKQCAGAGYTSTTVSQPYQKLVSESSAIFQNSSSNSTLRKIICMEVAPPCDHKNISTLYVPCKSTCENAYNESTSQFLDVFRSLDYCSVFPTMNKSYAEQEYCAFQAWPDAGYWPSGLWKSLFKAEPNKTSMDTSTPTATSAPAMATDDGTITEPAHSSTPVTHPEASPTIMAQGSTEGESMETTSAPILVPNATVSEESTTIVTTSVKISPTASSSAASEYEGNTTTPTSVSATTTLGGTSTALVSTVKGSPTATVATPAISKTEIHGSRNRTVTTNLKASSTASSAKSGSSTSAKTVSSTMMHGSITVTLLTNSTVSRPAVRSTTGSGIRQSKTVPMTVTTIMAYGTPSVSSTATKGKAPGVQVKTGKKLSAGAIAGIVLGILVGLAVIVFVGIGLKKYSKRRAQYRHSLMVDMDEL